MLAGIRTLRLREKSRHSSTSDEIIADSCHCGDCYFILFARPENRTLTLLPTYADRERFVELIAATFAGSRTRQSSVTSCGIVPP